MKKLKYLLTTLLIVIFSVTSFGCYMIQGQKMNDVKGTYKLTRYVYTPEYERREGYTPTTIDYIADRGYEVYLVVTGTGTGYYVHKDNETAAYSREVTLSYEYDTENSSSVEYVTYADVLSGSDTSGRKFGVTKNKLNYSKPALDYTQLITGKKMTSSRIDKDWEKVDKATDLSYVKKQLGSLKEYDYQGYGKRGIYEMKTYDAAGTTIVDDPYQYYFMMIDTANGVTTVKVYYALKSDLVPVVNTVTFISNDDYSVFTIDGNTWTVDQTWGNYYYHQGEETREQIIKVYADVSEEAVQELIQNKLPATE